MNPDLESTSDPHGVELTVCLEPPIKALDSRSLVVGILPMAI